MEPEIFFGQRRHVLRVTECHMVAVGVESGLITEGLEGAGPALRKMVTAPLYPSAHSSWLGSRVIGNKYAALDYPQVGLDAHVLPEACDRLA